MMKLLDTRRKRNISRSSRSRYPGPKKSRSRSRLERRRRSQSRRRRGSRTHSRERKGDRRNDQRDYHRKGRDSRSNERTGGQRDSRRLGSYRSPTFRLHPFWITFGKPRKRVLSRPCPPPPLYEPELLWISSGAWVLYNARFIKVLNLNFKRCAPYYSDSQLIIFLFLFYSSYQDDSPMLLSQANAVPFSSLNRHWHVQGRGAPGRTSTSDALKQRLQNLAGY